MIKQRLRGIFILLCLLCSVLSIELHAQIEVLPASDQIASAPHWATLMYADKPNVYEVDRAYRAFYKRNDFEKTVHTRYYKFWRKAIKNRIGRDGQVLSIATLENAFNNTTSTSNLRDNCEGNWSPVGPIQSYDRNNANSGDQVNVYCIDQSLSDSSIVYCGTESGEVYKSTDYGEHWENVSLDIQFPDVYWGLHVRSIAIDPTNPDIVFFSVNKFICKTTDGGLTWEIIYTSPFLDGWGFNVEMITIHPNNPNVIFVASRGGLLKSIDGGDTWNQVVEGIIYDVKFNTGSSNTMYAIKRNESTNLHEFLRSTDTGETFTTITEGWYTSTDPDRSVVGGRVAVSKADPSRVYAYLVGQSKAGDNGYIGVYRSDDAGLSWTLPNGPVGGPFSEIHPNMSALNLLGGGFNGGLYNCALMVSDNNPDHLLIGGLSLWRSDDGGSSFYPLGGYVGGPFNGAIHEEAFHVDMQDFCQVGNTTWITTDGGIYRSPDFFNTLNFEKKNQGIYGTEFWGLGSGWNQDVLVGGVYHNGNMSFFENWGNGEGLSLGGGEPATGYVNPGDNRLIYSSEIGARYLPLEIGGGIGTAAFGIDPNESYNAVGGFSELEFDPRCYSIAYTGKDNQLWKTTDKGESFFLINTFGDNADDRITYIEIARSNPDIMHVCQRLSESNSSALYKSLDGGETWSEITLPNVNYDQKTILQVDPFNPMNLWVAFSFWGTPSKVFRSTNGGASWTDLTTPTIANEFVQVISLVPGTNGGIYLSSRLGVFYRNNAMNDWLCFSEGLPAAINTLHARPFYRDGKIRIATNKGIWESELYESPTTSFAQIMTDKLVGVQSDCKAQDTLRFVDHSILNHSNATWNWTFEGATPATATGWQVDVVYEEKGIYLATLEIVDGMGNVDVDSLYITIGKADIHETTFEEDFEAVFPPYGFKINNVGGLSNTWMQNSDVGGYGLSSQCMFIPGYYSPAGAIDEALVALDLSVIPDPYLTFDVAYAIWGGQYVDTLEVLVTTDCGATYESLYKKGNADLATAPANIEEPFVPSPSEWRTDSIDLTMYANMENVQVLFRCIQGYGQHMYLDNIQLRGTPFAVSTEDISLTPQLLLYPNPVAKGQSLHLRSDVNETVEVRLYNMEGKQVYRQSHEPISVVHTAEIAPGAYVFRLATSAFIQQGLVIIH